MPEKTKKRKKAFPFSQTASGVEITADQHGDAYAVSARRGAETVATVALDTKALPALASGRFILSIGGVRDGEDVTAVQIDVRNAGALSGPDVAAAIQKVIGRVMRSAMKRVTPEVGQSLATQKTDIDKLMSTVNTVGA